MSEKPSNHPFYAWVPKPVGILILLLMFVPPTFSGGAYLCNVSEMSGDLGLWTEDVQMASFFTSIGMCLFPPFMVRFLQARRVKQTYLYGFLLLAVLNGVSAVATSRGVLFASCLLTGFVRIMVMLNCTFTIAPYLTGMDTLAMFTMTQTPPPAVQYQLERKRTFLMPVLYFVILLISQGSNMLMAWFAYAYRWQEAYYVVIGMLLVAMALVIITMPDEPRKPYRMEWRKIPGLLLMALALCSMTYVLVYGKTLDWMDSDTIFYAVVVMVLSSGAFLLDAAQADARGYLPLGVFRYRNVVMSMVLFLLTLLFNSASSFIAAYAKLATPINNVQGASLSGWSALGFFLGMLLSLALIARKSHFRIVFSVAFLLMAAANAYFYFQYQTEGLFRNMALPTVLNATGLLVLYAVVAAWGMKGLPSRYLATFVFLMIWMRNAIAPVVGVSVYSNLLTHRQQDDVTRLAQNVDAVNPLAQVAFVQTGRVGQAMGRGTMEANELAMTVLKGRIAKQAAITAMKDITGQTVLWLLGTTVVVLFLPYRKHEST